MVREALLAAQIVGGAAAVARALVSGTPMAPAEQTGEVPSDAQKRLDAYRQRERVFRSALAPPRGGSPEEQALYEKRVGIERVIFSLFPRKDATSVRLCSLLP